MARAVFQVRSPHVHDIDVNTGEDGVPRGHNKSLSLCEKITSLISCLPLSLYDLKKKFASCHENLNKLRVKLATCKDTSLVRQ
jgi:hypothetical protein